MPWQLWLPGACPRRPWERAQAKRSPPSALLPAAAHCRHLLQAVNPNSSWLDRIKEHLQDFPELDYLGLNLEGMGAPDGWEGDW